MANPTNPPPPSRRFAERTGRDVWTSGGPFGYLESVQAAGSVAAPLLAGASFTLVALVLQSASPFGRWQNFSLLLFVAAGLAQIFAVQSVAWARRYMAAPVDLRQWLPDDFIDRGERPTEWLQQYQRFNDERARRWAGRTRAWINAGITLLLAGIAVGVVPPGPVSPVRWPVITVAWIGVAVEASWVAAMRLDERARLGLLVRSGAIFTAGGATAAGCFAAAGTPGRAATWWAVALALAAALLWLAACTGARLRHGRVRLRAPLTGGLAIARAALAPVAPAVFVLALWSAVAEIARDRQQTLRDQHPGVEELLPAGVSLGAHHRAWSRCAALPAAAGDLAGLLAESGPLLAPDRQPDLAELREKVARSPGCVVQVVDRDDDRARLGYYAVYPLLETAVRRLRSGQITDGGQLRPADLAESPASTGGWYIAIIWAPGPPWTRRCVIATLVDALAAAGAGGPAQPVFGRPVTPLGRSLMRQYGFTAVNATADAISVLQKRTSSALVLGERMFVLSINT
jgi:hypothetical protein